MMTETPLVYTFNGLDLAFFIFCLLSAGMGLYRGVTREILSVGGWIGAAAGAVSLFPLLRPWVRSFIPNALVADLVAGGSLFIVLLTFFLILSQSLSARVKHSVLGGLDRTLGLLFGFLRGGVLICLVYAACMFLLPADKQPDFLRTAKSIPWIQQGEAFLKSLIPPSLRTTSAQLSHSLEKALPTQEDMEKTVEALSTLKPTSPPQKPSTAE